MTDLRHPHVLQVLALDQEESTLPVLERMDKSLDLGLDTHLALDTHLGLDTHLALISALLCNFVPLYWSVFVCDVCDLQCL